MINLISEFEQSWNENMSTIAKDCPLEFMEIISRLQQEIIEYIFNYHSGEIMKGYCYLMCYESGVYKIGFSNKPPRRRKESRGEPEIIHVIETDDMKTLESQIHEAFSKSWLASEIFNLSDQEVNEIKSVHSVFYKGKDIQSFKLF